MKKLSVLICVLALAIGIKAQTNVKFTINQTMSGQNFALGMEGKNNLGNDFKFSRLQYYISAMKLVHDGGKISEASDVYILMNGNKTDTVSMGEHNITKIEAVEFSVGVDPSVNNQDPTQWPKDHALSPKSPSMHWGWASGYRFAALEGTCGSGFSQKFELHALGNENFFKIRIPVESTDLNGDQLITINADYTMALKGINVSSGLILHGTDNQAVTLLKNFKNEVFTSTSGAGNVYASVQTVADAEINVYPNPNNGTFDIDLGKVAFDISLIRITDMAGKIIKEVRPENLSLHNFSLANSGVYIAAIESKDGAILNRKIVVQ